MRLSRIRKIVIAFAVIASLLILADIGIVYGTPRYIPEIDQEADAVIVLGAAINTPALYNRTIKGLEVYESGLANLMVFSGGKISPSDVSEASYMEKVVETSAKEDVNYFLEEESRNTYQNINNSKMLLNEKLGKKAGDTSIIIVSDEYHLGRAVMLAKRAGFEKVYWRAPKPDYYDSEQLKYYYFREFIAMFSYIPKFIGG